MVIEETTRELAHRTSNGVDVQLVWRPESDTLAVLVHDASTEETFELPVERDRALDAFHHPFAYAALRPAA